MEEQIKKAKQSSSLSSLGCRIIALVGIFSTLVYAFGLDLGNSKKSEYSYLILLGIVSSSFSIAALGSIADNSKKTMALTALLVESKNSASQLPILKESEYSDLNEDT